MARRQYGVLLPHFSDQASRERLVEGSRRIERLGYDSVWVRDHLVYHPHAHESPNRTHLDPFVVLSGIAAATDNLILGTGSLIPHRNPIHAALLIASLDFLAGPGRLIMGLGLGNYQHEFEACGLGHADRRELLEEQVAIYRKLWTGERVSHAGKYYQFADVDIHPEPSTPVPIWYCGTSPAAVRRAVEYCDGWLPSRIPLLDFEARIRRMRRLAGEAGKPVPGIGNTAYVVPGRTMEEALSYIDVPRLLSELARNYTPPPSGTFSEVEDLAGAVIVGPPDRIIEEVRRCEAVGCDHFVFDFRQRFRDFEECVQMVAEEVLPKLRR